MKVKTTLPGKRSVISGAVWAITYLVSVYIMTRMELGAVSAVIVAIIPIITFAIFVFYYIKGIAAMDEVKQRVQFEAVTIGFSLCLLMVMALFLLGLAIQINYDYFGYKFLVLYFIVFYYVGYIVSMRKYGA